MKHQLFTVIATLALLSTVHGQSDQSMKLRSSQAFVGMENNNSGWQKPRTCQRSAQQLFCPNDPIVSDDNMVGTVVGINPFSGDISFKSALTDSAYPARKTSVALGVGCLDLYCVGDLVVSHDGIVGRILAVNPYQKTVAFRTNYSGTDFNEKPEIRDFIIGGTETANVYTRPLVSLALGLGCVQGVCVNDTVVPTNSAVSKVLAVNPYSSDIAMISFNSSTVNVQNVSLLANKEYDSKYNQVPRSLPYFPTVNMNAFTIPSLNYSIRRPL